MNASEILIEAAIAADYLREHTNFEEAARILYEAAFVTLLPFCDPHPYRANIGEPFVKDGWMYATDARICVRVPCSQPDSEGRFPDVAVVFRLYGVKEPPTTVRHRDGGVAYSGLAAWQQWPTKPIWVKTEPDKQTGITCPLCHGEGETFWGGDSQACVYCDRTGLLERFENVELGIPFDASSPLIAGKYWSLISRLPDVWYREPENSEKPIHFRFRGGEGLLMQIDRSK